MAKVLVSVAATLLADVFFDGRLPQVDRAAAPAKTTAPTVADFMSMSDVELTNVDPLVINLTAAKGIPECAGLDIGKYAATVDEWTAAIRVHPSATRFTQAVSTWKRLTEKTPAG